MSVTAQERQQLLANLTEDDPAAVLAAALPAEFRAALPSEVQKFVEQEVDVEGSLEVLIEDHPHFSKTRYGLRMAKARLSLHFASDPPTQILSGSQVQVQGLQVNGDLALYSGNTSVQSVSAPTTTAPLPNTFGAQQTVVILVNFQDAPTRQPWTISQVQSAAFGSTGASGFILENSYQQTWLTGDVYGWYTLPDSSTTCNPTQMAVDADNAAAAAGVNLASYKRKVYVFPYDSACGWSGMALIGGSPSQAWMNGSIDPNLFAHELGHNLGLYHSHGLFCGSSVVGANCTVTEYGNVTDTMGFGVGDYNAFQKERLGWINYGASPPVTAVNVSGSYVIDPYETTGTSSEALKILKSADPTTGLRTWYYLEYRQPLGWDQVLLNYAAGNNDFTTGVLVSTGTESTPNSSDLLDMTPNSWGFAALAPGQTFTDPDAGVTIITESTSSTGASVQVTLTNPCIHANPSLGVSPSTASTPGTYNLTVTNNDASNCSGSTFNLAASAPNGWSATFATPSLTLNPGASASTTVTLTPGSSVPAGTYTISLSATNGSIPGYSAVASVSYDVALNVTVSTDSASYIPGSAVTITTTVTSGGSPASGAGVTFTITKPNGSPVTGSTTTGANGAASYVYKLKRSSPTGTWHVSATADANAGSGSGAAVFSVQ
jgi:Gametolysin peptidase M11/NPCBM-associated, NEW3 domain of alpha-galactosidase